MKRYLNLRLFFGLFLVLSLILAHPFAIYADVRDLMINTDSNALMTLDLNDDDYAVMPMSSLANITNTVQWDSDTFFLLRYKSKSNGVENTVALTSNEMVANSGGIHVKASAPDGYYWTGFICYFKYRDMDYLPPSGVYSMSADLSSNFSCTWYNPVLWTLKTINNASSINGTFSMGPYFDQSSGDFYVSPFVVDVSNCNQATFDVRIDSSEQIENVDFTFKVNFAKTSGNPVFEMAGAGITDTTYQDDVSSSLSDLSSSVDSMTEDLSSAAENLEYISTSQNLIIQGIDNVVMHISDQLFAFWNQLFNLIHVPTMAKMDDIIDAIRNMDLEIEVNLDGLKQSIQQASQNEIANDNKISADQIANDEANTEEVKDAVKEHGNFIIDGLKGLFIPSDEFFKAYFDDLYSYFSDRFGFLSFPIDLLVRTVNLFINSSDVDAVLTLPSFEISGEQVWADQSFNFTEFMETNFAFLLAAIRTVTSIGMIYAFVNLCQDKWDEVMKS